MLLTERSVHRSPDHWVNYVDADDDDHHDDHDNNGPGDGYGPFNHDDDNGDDLEGK